MRSYIKPRTVRKITKVTMIVMWLLAFFSIGKYEFDIVTSKHAFQSICLYMFWFVINGVIYISSES